MNLNFLFVDEQFNSSIKAWQNIDGGTNMLRNNKIYVMLNIFGAARKTHILLLLEQDFFMNDAQNFLACLQTTDGTTDSISLRTSSALRNRLLDFR